MRASRNWDDQRVMDPQQVAARFGAELMPCPFCACPTVGLHLGPSPHATCANCGADGPTFEGSSETIEHRQQQAVQAWNGSMSRPIIRKPEVI